MEELRNVSGPARRQRQVAAHNQSMRTLRLWFYRLCNLAMELERMQPVMDAVQTITEVVALLPF
jgi:hypothetical protein